MTDLFDYVEHPHLARRQEQGPPTTATAAQALHGTGRVADFNRRVGVRITVLVGTMWAAYLFTCLALGVIVIAGNYLELLPGGEVSNNFLLIGLALLIVGFVLSTFFR